VTIIGARPQIIKGAALSREINTHFRDKINEVIVHTGQHYDEKMSKAFFVDLGMPKPDIDLGVGSGSHAEQTGKIMLAFEKVCLQEKPDLVIVVGDVNSTMACTITAKKLGIQVAHVEAGLRSRDMSMPEEINRLCTDVLCDYLFTTDHFADENLRAEGVPAEKIHFVGNVMIDTLLKHKAMAATLGLVEAWGLEAGGFATMTLHRPGNVDDPEILQGLLEALATIAKELPIIFPIHPRTRKMAEEFGLGHYFNSGDKVAGIWCTEPLGYLEFLHLNMNARLVLTDSGGLQEETTVLGVPCVTIRPNTERPITCSEGTNVLVGNDPQKVLEAADAILHGPALNGCVPEKWDGRAAERIVGVLMNADQNRQVSPAAGSLSLRV
ncbi:MAG: UDP-N-acetylglucosamine 2-epimerase (non-hydrolyzing), partial [Desulfuromonadales bacterium]|nr:UDP-N-acetylglucosamine 2-epimerase (non-hydrolyzing) [Desulfuromonadales bacterium]